MIDLTNDGPTPEGFTKVSFDFIEIHELSLRVLQSLEDAQVEVPKAVLGLALSMGRVMSPDILSDADEVKFLQAIIEWGSTYFAPGSLN